MSAEYGVGSGSRQAARAVDHTDYLKTAAILLVLVDHTGYFFIQDADWWHVFGRLAAPPFFFLMGYAHSRKVPPYWIVLGVILTLLDGWNTDWSWVPLNILMSFALFRAVRPCVEAFALHGGWLAFVLLVSALVALQSPTLDVVDYGTGGWLWALFGMYQRLHVDGKSISHPGGAAKHMSQSQGPDVSGFGSIRFLACMSTAVAYVWQEQADFLFPQVHLAVLILAIGFLSFSLCLFRRGPSRIQPPEPVAGVLRITGRHTLEIYAIHLAGSELVVKAFPDLAP